MDQLETLSIFGLDPKPQAGLMASPLKSALNSGGALPPKIVEESESGDRSWRMNQQVMMRRILDGRYHSKDPS